MYFPNCIFSCTNILKSTRDDFLLFNALTYRKNVLSKYYEMIEG